MIKRIYNWLFPPKKTDRDFERAIELTFDEIFQEREDLEEWACGHRVES